VEFIRQAIGIIERAFKKTKKTIKPGLTEREIAIEMEYRGWLKPPTLWKP